MFSKKALNVIITSKQNFIKRFANYELRFAARFFLQAQEFVDTEFSISFMKNSCLQKSSIKEFFPCDLV